MATELDEKSTKKFWRARQLQARAESLHAQQRLREEQRAKTRRYWLGCGLEKLVRGDAALRVRVEECVRYEVPRVRLLFRDADGVSWFEQPEREEMRAVMDGRRSRLGVIAERLALQDTALQRQLEVFIAEQASRYVREVFGLEGGRSWFERDD